MISNDNDDATRWEVRDDDERGAEYYANGRHIADIDVADTYPGLTCWMLTVYRGERDPDCLDCDTRGAALEALKQQTGHPGTTTPDDAPGDCEGKGERDVLSLMIAHVEGYQWAEQYQYDNGGPLDCRGAVRACNDVLEIIDDIRNGRC